MMNYIGKKENMKADDLIYYINKLSSENLRPISTASESTLKTFGFENIKEISNKYIKNLFLIEKSLTPTIIYYDYPYCCSMIVMDKTVVGHSATIDETIESVKTITNKNIQREKYSQWLLSLPHGICFEYLNRLFTETEIISKNMIDAFRDIYVTENYNFELIDENVLMKIKNNLTDEYMKNIKNLPEKDGRVTVYRGIGDKSNPAGVSWTLNKMAAYNFACFYNSNEAAVLTGKVKKEDIIIYFDEVEHEREVIVLPKDIEIINKEQQYNAEEISDYISGSIYYDILNNFYVPIVSNIYRSCNDDEYKNDRTHIIRVLLHATVLSYFLNIDLETFRDILTAVSFHNYNEINDESLLGMMHRYLGQFNDDVKMAIEFLHRGDDIFSEALDNKSLSKAQRKRNELIYKVLYDSDTLDRVRFGIYALDINNLHIPESKQLILYARTAVESIK